MDIKKLAKECGAVLFRDGEDNLYCINFTPSDLELFAQKIRDARDAEWMADPVAKCFMSTTSDDEGRFYQTLVAGLLDAYPEELDGKKTILYAQPKEAK